GLAGLYIRRQIPEPPLPAKPTGPSPIIEAFRTEWRGMLRIAAFNMLNAVGFYLIFVYAVTYMKEVVHLKAAQALDINTLNMVVLLLLVPVAGSLSDRTGRRPLLFAAGLGVLLLSWPLFWLMHHPSFALALCGQLGFAVLLG